MIWFDGWESIYRTVVTGAVAYAALVLFLRISGKRTLAKMNAFDFVITVALGSTLSAVVVSKDVAVASGVVALAMLILLQYIVTFAMVRSAWFQRVIRSQPALLYGNGAFDENTMRRERVVKEEILAAMRDGGFDDPAYVKTVHLETDGTFSVIGRD